MLFFRYDNVLEFLYNFGVASVVLRWVFWFLCLYLLWSSGNHQLNFAVLQVFFRYNRVYMPVKWHLYVCLCVILGGVKWFPEMRFLNFFFLKAGVIILCRRGGTILLFRLMIVWISHWKGIFLQAGAICYMVWFIVMDMVIFYLSTQWMMMIWIHFMGMI